MSTNFPLFDLIISGPRLKGVRRLTGEDRKRSGMKSVDRHTPQAYKDAFRSAVESFPKGKLFTVEDVRDIVGDPPPDTHVNAMGSLMRAAGLQGLAKKTGYHVKAQRASRHSNESAQWIKL